MSELSARHGHFRLESGLHADRWFDLDALFCDTRHVASSIDRLATALRRFAPTAVCGPMVGGAFLAQAVAMRLDARFHYTEAHGTSGGDALFAARYRLPPAQVAALAGARVAVVDDMISAGSSVRATIDALTEASASVVAVGTLYLSGTVAVDHFAAIDMPLVALERYAIGTWTPAECPLCRRGDPLDSPR